MTKTHSINLMFGDNWTKASALSSAAFFFDISNSSRRSRLADVTYEMHFSLRVQIMLPLWDQSSTSSTNVPEGVSPFGNSTGSLLLPPKASPPCQPWCSTSLPVNRLGLQSCRGTQVVEGIVGVKQEWKESICDESEGEGRLT